MLRYKKRVQFLRKESTAKAFIALISILSILMQSSTTFEYQLNSEEQCSQYCVKVPKPDENSSIDKNNCSTRETNMFEVVERKVSQLELKSCAQMNSNCSIQQLIKDIYCCRKKYFIRTEFTNLGKNLHYNTALHWFKMITFLALPSYCIIFFNFFIVKAFMTVSLFFEVLKMIVFSM